MLNNANNALINEIHFLRDEINQFIESAYLSLDLVNNKFIVGVKRGYSKQLYILGYKRKDILRYLALIENGLNMGLICEKCLKVGKFGVDDANAFYSICPKCRGALI